MQPYLKMMKTLGDTKVIGPLLIGLGLPIEIAPLRSSTSELINLASIAAYSADVIAVSYTHLRAHETLRYLVCRLLLEKKK